MPPLYPELPKKFSQSLKSRHLDALQDRLREYVRLDDIPHRAIYRIDILEDTPKDDLIAPTLHYLRELEGAIELHGPFVDNCDEEGDPAFIRENREGYWYE